MPYKPQYKQYHINDIIANTLKIADMPFPSHRNPACKRCVRYFDEREPLHLSVLSDSSNIAAKDEQVTHLPTYPPMTGTFPENVDYKYLLLYIL